MNVVQCAGSMTSLAKKMEDKYEIPFTKVSFFGLEDIRVSLRSIAYSLGDFDMITKVEEFVKVKEKETDEKLEYYRKRLARITSYNVCYTKLLRELQNQEKKVLSETVRYS